MAGGLAQRIAMWRMDGMINLLNSSGLARNYTGRCAAGTVWERVTPVPVPEPHRGPAAAARGPTWQHPHRATRRSRYRLHLVPGAPAGPQAERPPQPADDRGRQSEFAARGRWREPHAGHSRRYA